MALVCLSRKIKTNYFIVSLAFADLLVSVMVMPFGAIELVHQNWIYGETFCLVRTSLDVLLTTASILHLCCISLDRWAVYYALHTKGLYSPVHTAVILYGLLDQSKGLFYIEILSCGSVKQFRKVNYRAGGGVLD